MISKDKVLVKSSKIKKINISNQDSLNGSTKQNYVWNLFGTASSSLISVILLLFASRLLDSHSSDVFSIAYALGATIFCFRIFPDT